MKEHPIIFSTQNVLAVLTGDKTQTRRVIRSQPKTYSDLKEALRRCPYGHPGDRLWVRESFQVVQPWGSLGDEWIGDDVLEIDGPLGHDKPELVASGWWSVLYKAGELDDLDTLPPCIWWRPAIFMPRWASRIVLQIKSVKVQRLQMISEADCLAEGVPAGLEAPRIAFHLAWDKLNRQRGFGWGSNPWVWVVEFVKQEMQK